MHFVFAWSVQWQIMVELFMHQSITEYHEAYGTTQNHIHNTLFSLSDFST